MIPFMNSLEVVVPSGSSFLQVTNGTNVANLMWSNGNPEGAVTAPPGSLCLDFTSGSLFVKSTGVGNTGWANPSAGATDLSILAAPTSITVLSSTGIDAVLPVANGTDAGLLAPAQHTKLGHITVTAPVNLDTLGAGVTSLVTLSGMAAGSTHLGTFTGTTINDDVTVKTALQSLENAVESRLGTALPNSQLFVGSGANVATAVAMSGDVTINNTGFATVVAASTTVAGKVELSTDAETLAGTSTTLAVTPDSLDAYLTVLAGNTSGIANLGTFSGTTIADNVSIKTALQSLETALEGVVAGLQFAGTWDATTADPSGALTNGQFYRVSVAGSTSVTTLNLGAVTSWAVGDFLLKDNLGNVHKIDNTDPILSVVAITHATLDVSNGGSSATIPAAVPSTTQISATGTAGVVSGNDKFKLNNTGGYAQAYGDGVATSFTITHNLGSADVQVGVRRVSDGMMVVPQVAVTSVNALSITHAIAPTASQYRVVVSRTSVA